MNNNTPNNKNPDVLKPLSDEQIETVIAFIKHCDAICGQEGSCKNCVLYKYVKMNYDCKHIILNNPDMYIPYLNLRTVN